MEEENTPTTSDTEDVEAHGVVERTPAERTPSEDRETVAEEPEVEGHLLLTPTETPTE